MVWGGGFGRWIGRRNPNKRFEEYSKGRTHKKIRVLLGGRATKIEGKNPEPLRKNMSLFIKGKK